MAKYKSRKTKDFFKDAKAQSQNSNNNFYEFQIQYFLMNSSRNKVIDNESQFDLSSS